MIVKVVSLFLVALLIASIWGQQEIIDENIKGTYLILAPKVIRANLPYSVSVNILKSKDPVNVKLRLANSENVTLAETSEKISSGKPSTLKIDKVPHSNSYILYLTGTLSNGNILFTNQLSVQFNSKSLSVFIQTDKAIYKPGAIVHFRIVAVTPDLKPFKGVANIKISDPNRNIIQLFANQTIDKGVIGKKDSLKLQLIDEPPLGDWKIIAEIDSQTVEKSFTVDKYVLPKFDVTLNVPPYLSKDDDCTVTVISKYTYGKGVSGKATVLLEQLYLAPLKLTKTVELSTSGETNVRFTNGELKENQFIPASGNGNLRITATVVEDLTGIQKNATGTVVVYENPYLITIDVPSETFKAGLEFPITIAVTTPDGKAISSKAEKSVRVTVTYTMAFSVFPVNQETPNTDVKNLTLGSDGTVTLTLKPPVNVTNMNILAEYAPKVNNNNPVSTSRYVEATKSPTNSYLQITTSEKLLTPGHDATFLVKSTSKDLESTTVQVLSRGYIVYSSDIKLSDYSSTFKIHVTKDMAPKARILVYGVLRSNKEILVDAIDVSVNGLFSNNVSIEVDPKRAEPNDTVHFKIKASPDSYIGLLAVDQSVLLLKSGNDITHQQVESDTASYSTTGTSSGGFGEGELFGRKRRSVCFWCGWISGKDASTIFENSGVTVLTDAFLYHEPPPPSRRLHFGGGGGGGRKSVSLGLLEKTDNDDIDDSRSNSRIDNNASVKPVIRKFFPETWIWSDIITQYTIMLIS